MALITAAQLNWSMEPLVPSALFLDWIATLAIVSFAGMGVDKLLAATGHWRISERTFWTAAMIGGFLGVIAGGWAFHHKTSKPWFWVPVVLATALWAAAAALEYRIVG